MNEDDSTQPLQMPQASAVHPPGPPSSSPREAGMAVDRGLELDAALAETIETYRQGTENGPYPLRGEWSPFEFEELAGQREPKWRLGYDKRTRQILLYGDPTLPHESTIGSLRDAIKRSVEQFFRNLGPTADTYFNDFSASERASGVLVFSGGQSRDLGASIKQADELLRLEGVTLDRIAIAVEVAFGNESGRRVAEETVAWVRDGRAEFALAVKIKKNLANPIDPAITFFFCDSRERYHDMQGSSTRAVPIQKAVLHEWPCGSRSPIAPKPCIKIRTEDLDSLNLDTAASKVTSNPSKVDYDQDFITRVHVNFHGDGDPANSLQFNLGRLWADEDSRREHNLEFSAADWKALHDLVVTIDLGRLRGEIVHHMGLWVAEGCPS